MNLVAAYFGGAAALLGAALGIHVCLRKFTPTYRMPYAIARLILAIIGLAPLIMTLYLLASYFGPRPAATDETWFQGVRYVCDVIGSPRPVNIHRVTIDLTIRGIKFIVTPSDTTAAPRHLHARTTREFIHANDVQIAINANYFTPFRDNAPWDAYPHRGDPVTVIGIAASDDVMYSTKPWNHATLFIRSDGSVGIGEPPTDTRHAVSGRQFILRNGKIIPFVVDAVENAKPYPRLLLALNEARSKLTIILMDGKQPYFSEGLTLAETAEYVKQLGCFDVIEMDGGGSCSLLYRDAQQNIRIANRPAHSRIPRRERPVANHLGIRIPLTSPNQ